MKLREIGLESRTRSSLDRSALRLESPDYPAVDLPLESEDGTFAEYGRLLLRNKLSLLLAVLVCVAAAVALTVVQTPQYRARTTVEVQGLNSDFLNARQISPIAEESASANAALDVQTQMNILQSEQVLDRSIASLQRAGQLPPSAAGNSLFARLQRVFHLAASEEDTPAEQLQEALVKKLKVQQMGQTRVLEITFQDPDPRFAAAFLNALTREYIENNMETRWRMSEHTGEWLSRQLNTTRAKLKQSENALQDYARKSGLLFTGAANGSATEVNVTEEKLQQLQDSLSEAQAARVVAQSKYEIAKQASPDTLGDVLSDTSLRGLQDKLTDLHRQEAELSTTFTPQHEKVRRVHAQIGPLEAALASEKAAILDRLHNDYDGAARREHLLEADYATQRKVVTDQANKSVQYGILKHEVDSNRQTYEGMLQQISAATVASTVRASNVHVVDLAKVPRRPYSPKLSLNVALGVLVGLLSGIGWIVVRHRNDRTLRQPGDAQFWTRMPELGVIPSFKPQPVMLSSPRAVASRGKSILPLRAAMSNGDRVEGQPFTIPLAAGRANLSSEAFRSLVTSILIAGVKDGHSRVLAITSAHPGEGKTTISCNLAAIAAEVAGRVLVIDADLRKPQLHSLFRVDQEPGLSTLLTDGLPPDGDFSAFLRPTGTPGLKVLPSGSTTDNAATLLHSRRLRLLLSQLRRDFDLILIDTPPLFHVSDSRVVGRSADAVIVVTRSGRTTRDDALAVAERFAADQTSVLGVILNDWDPSSLPDSTYSAAASSFYRASSPLRSEDAGSA